MSLEMRVQAEYSAQTGSVTMRLCYNGDRYDPTEQTDWLRQALIRNAAKDIRYRYCPDDALKNEITLTVL